MEFLPVNAALLCNLLVAVGFEFLDQLPQCRQAGKTCSRRELQIVHSGNEPGVAGYLYQLMESPKSSRRSLHPLDNFLLPVGIRDRPGIITVAHAPQDLL